MLAPHGVGCYSQIGLLAFRIEHVSCMSVLIRAATAADVEAIAHLRTERHELLRQSDRRFVIPADAPESWLEDPHAHILIAEVSQRIVAYGRAYTGQSPLGAVPEHHVMLLEMALDAHRYYGGTGSAMVKTLRSLKPTLLVAVPRYHAVEQAFWLALGAKPCRQTALLLEPALEWMCL